MNEKTLYYECLLSDARCYEKDNDYEWTEHLAQFCPLTTVDEIINEAYENGKQYTNMKEDIETNIRLSTEPVHWFTAQEFLEKLQNIK